MSSIVKFKMTGLDELDKAVKKLPDRIQKRVLSGALRAGGRIMQKDAKARVPVKTGKLKKSIKVMSGKSNPNAPIGVANAVVFVGVQAAHGHLIEFGTKNVTAKPFLRPAFDSTQEAVLTAIGNKLAEGIIKETAKL